ncbi:uncharacterized protein LOC100370422 [Saccoglossus kowalevskii]|uniref:Acidic repeat-containing protein-like n=1 Tax=Saccoglossus kowalevskii TaxID=10224 RepID=A0ABM0GV85_SACKO|nr:PREDICTED: acidic repeat-containing protein-like [Saccoglossus kowalevskii]
MSDIDDLFHRVSKKLGWSVDLEKPKSTEDELVDTKVPKIKFSEFLSDGSPVTDKSFDDEFADLSNKENTKDCSPKYTSYLTAVEPRTPTVIDRKCLLKSPDSNIIVVSSDADDEDSSDDDVFMVPLRERMQTQTCPPNVNKSVFSLGKHLKNGILNPDTESKKKSNKSHSYRNPKPSYIDVSSDDDEDFELLLSRLKTPKKTIHFSDSSAVPSKGTKRFTPKQSGKPAGTSKPVKTNQTTNSVHIEPIKKETADGNFLSSLADSQSQKSSSIYIREFRKNRDELTQRLFSLYNRTVFKDKLPSDMKITWNPKMRKTAGFCYYGRIRNVNGIEKTSRVELADKVCDSAERLRDTLIHELCHAAAWLVNGVHDGHGRYWKYWASLANLIHPQLPIISRCHTYEIHTKFTYQCVKCGYQIGRHSKSLKTDKFCCGICKGRFELLPQLKKDGTPAKTKTPNKFAIFVKDNYSTVKSKDKTMKHADIMKVLSAEFASKAKISTS